MSFLTLVGISAALYTLEVFFFSYAARLARRVCKRKSTAGSVPRVTIVVAAKDEEKNLQECIDSLTNLDYPSSSLEIIIVNDKSTDSTAAIVDKAASKFPFLRRVDASESALLRGKTNALSQGIQRASGDFIFLTDADCAVGRNWIKDTLEYFDEGTGIVAGVTLVSKTTKRIDGIQALDWTFLLTVGAGLATVGRPLACLGNNLAFRRKAYDDVGGYRKIKFSVTEDYALFKAIVKSGKWGYKYPMDKLTLVETLPLT
ncbi:MAG: glycosyltransferase, partial [Bacteroidetes bacterium]|nr:glycosyltransferase [Bacteroidota bacterium]